MNTDSKQHTYNQNKIKDDGYQPAQSDMNKETKFYKHHHSKRLCRRCTARQQAPRIPIKKKGPHFSTLQSHLS